MTCTIYLQTIPVSVLLLDFGSKLRDMGAVKDGGESIGSSLLSLIARVYGELGGDSLLFSSLPQVDVAEDSPAGINQSCFSF